MSPPHPRTPDNVVTPEPEQVPSLTRALAMLADGSLTATALLARCTAQSVHWDAVLGTYVHRAGDAAAVAAAVDEDRAAGRPLGALAGVPLGVKDIVATAGQPTRAQSLVHPLGMYGGQDAPVVARLRAAGAVLTGKTSTMEFALGFPDPEKPFPTPRNPWDLQHWSGGSSSGTANGVATGQFLGGVGTDTAGSIRMPSAWNGITGIKPTYGRVPVTGVVPLGWSVDHVGPMARTAEDCALLLQVMAGAAADDPTSADESVPDYTAALSGDLTGLRIGVVREPVRRPACAPEVVTAFEDAVQVLAEAGADLVEVDLPHYEQVHAANMSTLLAEAFAYHQPVLIERWSDFGRPTRLALAEGALVGAGDYVQLQRIRRAGREAADRLFETVDALITPTSTLPAPRLDDLDFAAVVASFCVPYWNATGHPALSIPMGTSRGLPVGLQVVGAAFDEATVLRVGHAFQQRTTHHEARPPLPTPTPEDQR